MTDQADSPSIVDYLAQVIGPVLVMGMAFSLLSFLLCIGYSGDYDGRLLWILGCFTVGIVLIARIGVESGQDRSLLFAMALAGATMLAIFRFVSPALPALVILAIVWWFTHQLTWDSTHIDEEADVAGEGLLAVSGLDRILAAVDEPEQAAEPGQSATEETNRGQRTERKKARQRIQTQGALEQKPAAGKKRTPGVWIVYFSLAALPLFGLGQSFVSAQESVQGATLRFMICYLACGFGLLATTSLMSLRRYLAQRGAEMPANILGTWLGLAAAIIGGVLAVTLLVPRPSPAWTAAAATGARYFTSAVRKANSFSLTPGEGAQGKSQTAAQGEKPDPNAPSGSGSQTQGQGAASKAAGQANGQGSQGSQSNGQGNQSNGQQNSGPNSAANSSRGNSPSSSQGQPRSSGQPSSSRQPRSSGEQGAKDLQRNQASSGQQQGGQSPAAQGPNQGQSQQGAQSGQQAGSAQQQQPNGSKENMNSGQQPSSPSSKPNESPAQAGSSSSPGNPPQQTSPEKSSSRENKASPQSSDSGDSEQKNENKQDRRAEGTGTGQNDKTANSSSAPFSSPGSGSNPLGSALQALSSQLGWLKYVVAVVLILALLWMFWRPMLLFLTSIVKELQELWLRLFGGERTEDVVNKVADEPKELAFADYLNPFRSGFAQGAPAPKIVAYSYEALKAWARDRGLACRDDLTPLEVCEMVRVNEPNLAEESEQLALYVSGLSYARRGLPDSALPVLSRLWEKLEAFPKT